MWTTRKRGGGKHESPVPYKAYRRKKGGRYVVACFRPTPGGKVVQRYVHRLVMEAFVGPCPDGLEVLHGDDNTANNQLGNLSYGKHTTNIEQRMMRGRGVKVSREDVADIRKRYRRGMGPVLAAEKGISLSQVNRIARGAIRKLG